ncbi:hypothetical protein LIER_18102 [Lithospermum erythrorhizon]|uniref:SURP motif domain-containing protein n=1 Tax=Lithospermum erythrorhizon TaxID=34254 RepID=A0AAV3QCR0_LITER
MDGDDEDMVFYGTRIQAEDDVSSRKKKSVAEAAGQLRTLPSWKQEVRDEEGRRRFHGAFTGGYSAGYYNSVGSKEGWTPSTFTSSRKNRAELKQQSIANFLDEDEKTEMEDRSLGTSMQFDTFGFTAVELAKKQADKEHQQRPSAIPGPVPDEMVAPVTESIGVKLLLKMGWRRGRSIKESQTTSLYDKRREARKAFLALAPDAKEQTGGPDLEDEDVADGHTINVDQSTKTTPVYVLNPKQDLHGLGYDPYKHAPEFREKKRLRVSDNNEKGRRKPLSFQDSLFGFKSGRVAPGFGIGALEELDVEDVDVYAPGYDFEETYQIEDIEDPSGPGPGNVKMLDNKQHGILLGFKAASVADYQLERFNPPLIPKDFTLHHKFSAPLEIGYKVCEVPPPEVPPPEDNNLKVLIEGVATLVARCGILFEDLSREKNRSNPLFAFLSGGNGHEFYKRKLWEERQKHNDKTKQQSDSKVSQSAQKMTAESRGRILGEKPLERSSRDLTPPIPSVSSADTANLQFDLSNTFTQPASQSQLPEVAKPFLHDPAKQERFEQFLKEKYRGGLRVIDAGEASKMSEAARARERLEFESTAEVIAKGNSGKESKTPSLLLADVLASSGLQFTASIEKSKGTNDGVQPEANMYPRREEYQWRPSPLLCKRFDLIDPFMGKPPPAPRPRNKMESFMFMPDSSKSAKVGESLNMDKDLLFTDQPSKERAMEPTEDLIEVAEVENVERPVDLYKAIFSDDSDEEGESTNPSQVDDPERKIEAANTTLSRLIAGDFLESLGKELGLEVPPDLPYSESKASVPNAQKQSSDAKGERDGLQPCGQSSNSAAVGGISADNESSHDVKEVDRQKNSELLPANATIKKDGGESEKPKKDGTSKRVYQHGTSSSSEGDSSRKHRRHIQRSRSIVNETSSSSDDYEDRHRSRSKKKDKGSSRDGGSRSGSKHHRRHKHKHKRKESPSGSRHGSERERKERREAKKEGHKYSARG